MNNAAPDLYPSRVGASTTQLPRLDPVIHGPGTAGPLGITECSNYESRGYLELPGVLLPDELTRLRKAAETLRVSPDVIGRPEAILEPGGRGLRSIFRPHRFHAELGALVSDSRLVSIAEQLLGSAVYVHQARINYKPAFTGREFYWHSDFETWHVEDGLPRMRALSISLNLTDNNEFNGPLMVIPGSHRHYVSCAGFTPENNHEKSLRAQEYGVPDHATLTRLVADFGIEAPKGKAGGITVFDCNLMHGSGANISPWPRWNVFVVYNSVENALVEPFSGQAPRPLYIAERSVRPVAVTSA